MRPILVQAGLGEAGGVTVDVMNLAEGLERRRYPVRLAGSLSDLRRDLRAGGESLVHVFGCLPSTTTFGALTLARAARRPLVWTPIFNPIRPHTWAGYGLLRVMEVFDRVAPRVARFTDAVLAATESEAEYFTRIGSRRVEVIPPGVTSILDPPAPERVAAFRADRGLDGGPLVLMVARDNSRKALPFGLAAFTELRRRVPDAQLLLVGPPADFHAASLPGVACPGWLDPDAIDLAYTAADVLFVSSLYEGLPRAVIESWRCGTPVVATDRVALAPTIDGVGGAVVPYGDVAAAADALATLLADDQLRARFGSQGQQLVRERFLMPSLVDATVALYGKVLASSTATSRV